MQAELGPPSEWRRHGFILLPCVAGMLLVAFSSYSLGVMTGPIEREFGWARAQISVGPLIFSVLGLIFAPLVGRAIDRLGARPVALVGVLFFCAALALLSQATADVRSWWGLWTLLGVANVFIAPMLWTSAINMRFDRNRGLALAITLCGTSLAAAVLPPVTNALVGHYGWRGGYIGLGAFGAALAFPLVVLFLRDLPRETRLAAAQLSGDADVRAQLTSAKFLRLAAAIVGFTIPICALTTNGVLLLLGEGFERKTAAEIAGLIGIGGIVGRLTGGWLLDRFDGRAVTAVSVLAPVVTAVVLLTTQNSQPAATFAFVMVGLSVGAELDCCAYLTARHFGMRNFGALFGVIAGLILLCNGIAPLAANFVYDLTRSYDLVMIGIIPMCVASAGLFLSLGRYPDAVPLNP